MSVSRLLSHQPAVTYIYKEYCFINCMILSDSRVHMYIIFNKRLLCEEIINGNSGSTVKGVSAIFFWFIKSK